MSRSPHGFARKRGQLGPPSLPCLSKVCLVNTSLRLTHTSPATPSRGFDCSLILMGMEPRGGAGTETEKLPRAASWPCTDQQGCEWRGEVLGRGLRSSCLLWEGFPGARDAQGKETTVSIAALCWTS